MLNRVARSALAHHTPFLHIFQQAAARAYIRVQCGGSRANSFDTGLGDTSSRESFDPISHPRNVKLASPRRLSGNLPVRCRLVRHYSSPTRAKSAPLLPVFSDTPSYCAREKVKKRLPLSQKKNQRNQPPRYVLMQTPNAGDTSNKESLTNSRVDSLEHAPTSSTPFEDDPPSILPEVHDDTSRSAVTKSSVHHSHNSLSQRLLRLYMSSPHVSIQSLVSYHNTFPDQQSSRSFNLLLRLAIRHSAFGTARALIRSMRASRVPEDQTTWKLCVRLLVREGRWADAYNLVYNLPKSLSRTPFISDGIVISVWVELLGTVKRRAFRDLRLRDPGMCTLAHYRHLMRQLPKLEVSSMDTPPPQVVYASVAALLRMQEREAARQLTTRFLPLGLKGLGLRLLHLHVAPEPRTRSMKTFYRAIRDLQGFRALCPELVPNSTTLYLLLGHLKGVKQCGIIGHKLVRWFRRRWGNSVVSPGVERRLLALAVKEKRVGLIKEWMTCVETRRKVWWMWSLEREVVDGTVPRQRSLTRDPDLRLGNAGREKLYVDRLLRRASRVLKREGKRRGLTDRVYVGTG
ncbi:hypothetical protein F5888DRAFT_63555 [Russula emetica]|nr:hypothetical protein F5888DRAFT_63555 [Russula emetica]